MGNIKKRVFKNRGWKVINRKIENNECGKCDKKGVKCEKEWKKTDCFKAKEGKRVHNRPVVCVCVCSCLCVCLARVHTQNCRPVCTVQINKL